MALILSIMSKRSTLLPNGKTFSNSNRSFNINLSRLTSDDCRDSMLAYTEKLRTLKENRARGSSGVINDFLHVRARQIPKFSNLEPKKIVLKKPFTLNEISKRKTRSLDGDGFERSVFTSPRLSLPGTSSQFKQVEVEDATNTCDILTNDMNTTTTKVEEYLRSSILPPIQPNLSRISQFKRHLHISLPNPKASSETTDNLSPKQFERLTINVDKRPKRAKRMKLKGSFLYDIPERDTPESSSDVTELTGASLTNLSQKPESIPNGMDSSEGTVLDVQNKLHETTTSERKNNINHIIFQIDDKVLNSTSEKQSEYASGTHAMNNSSQPPGKSFRTKPNKKTTKLVFLRDVPND